MCEWCLPAGRLAVSAELARAQAERAAKAKKRFERYLEAEWGRGAQPYVQMMQR